MPNPKEKRIFTVATAHLDTSWLWTLETTIEHLIPNTLRRNFALFEKYPEYRFNFEGSYRYELMEEYYPEDFARLKKYIAQGRWVPTGSSYENGDVNMPSPEALFRSILLGNDYFEKQFGVRCVDIFLPDCFGFGYALPSVMAHAGLYGFATCKLTWGSAVGRPFDIGKWYGVDGSCVLASIRPGPYSAALDGARGNKGLRERLESNERDYSMPFAYRMYGTGDMGGAPSAYSASNVDKEVRGNAASDIQVLSAAARDVFDAIKEELSDAELAALPAWDGEFLLTDHGVGSYTSRTVSNRWNRRCEQLADMAERSLVAAEHLGVAEYPKARLTEAWKRALAHHFHDDITGTSFEVCYKRNWNDYVLSMNQLAEEYTYANRALSSLLDTSFAGGTPVVINNALATTRAEAVSAEVMLPAGTAHVKVIDSAGTQTPAQISEQEGERFTVTFLANLPPLAWKVYDIQAADAPDGAQSLLKITENSIENENLALRFDKDGDIISLFDKRHRRETLARPIRMVVLPDYSQKWPAWELRYQDVMSAEKRYPTNASFKIAEAGPARVTLEITRTLGSSSFSQWVSLDAGADYARCYNEVDWRETKSLLKAEFPFSVANENAAYDLGLGVRQRGTNQPSLYEVPLQNWMDITTPDGSYGVSVLNDSKSGADKPADNTLRLTLIHTPAYSYRWECSQHLMDLGHNRFSFGVYPHAGNYDNGTEAAAAAFNQPLNAFATEPHGGSLGTEYVFGSLNQSGVILRAVKKAENGEKIVVRFNEGNGQAVRGVRFALLDGIESAAETLAVETPLRPAKVEGGELVFDMKPFEVKTFALTLKNAHAHTAPGAQAQIPLPCNACGVTANGHQALTQLMGGVSVPAELYPDTIVSGGVRFATAKDARNGKNVLVCRGQRLELPEGTQRAHLLMCSVGGDAEATFRVGERPSKIKVQDAFEAVGAWDLIGQGETGYIKRAPLAWNATHTHDRTGDVAAKLFYLFSYTFDLDGATCVTLPQDERIVVFALTADFENTAFRGMPLYDVQEKRPFDYTISAEDMVKARPTLAERLMDRVISREKLITASLPMLSATVRASDGYAIARQFINQLKGKV